MSLAQLLSSSKSKSPEPKAESKPVKDVEFFDTQATAMKIAMKLQESGKLDFKVYSSEIFFS
jgi:hypothetical protein